MTFFSHQTLLVKTFIFLCSFYLLFRTRIFSTRRNKNRKRSLAELADGEIKSGNNHFVCIARWVTLLPIQTLMYGTLQGPSMSIFYSDGNVMSVMKTGDKFMYQGHQKRMVLDALKFRKLIILVRHWINTLTFTLRHTLGYA